jgi:hypothetical protein
MKQVANGDEEAGARIPETWATIASLPPFPRPARWSLACEWCLGHLVVGLLCCMFVAITIGVTMTQDSIAARFFRHLICAEAIVAMITLLVLQCVSFGAIRRTPGTCFPLPDVLEERLLRECHLEPLTNGAWARAASGLGNVRDDDGHRGVYCVRCFVWRSADGHHCGECQRCVNDFDHHCGVLGCCVHGRGSKGNMWLFIMLISMAAVGLATTIATPIVLFTRIGDYWHLVLLALLGVVAIGYGGYRGFMWLFYDRHAERKAAAKEQMHALAPAHAYAHAHAHSRVNAHAALAGYLHGVPARKKEAAD